MESENGNALPVNKETDKMSLNADDTILNFYAFIQGEPRILSGAEKAVDVNPVNVARPNMNGIDKNRLIINWSVIQI